VVASRIMDFLASEAKKSKDAVSSASTRCQFLGGGGRLRHCGLTTRNYVDQWQMEVGQLPANGAMVLGVNNLPTVAVVGVQVIKW